MKRRLILALAVSLLILGAISLAAYRAATEDVPQAEAEFLA